MRIAYVADNYPPDLGGIEVVVSELARRTAAAGHEVEVFAHASGLTLRGNEWRDGVLVRRFSSLRPSRDLIISPSLLTALVRNRARFDVVHAHNYHALPALGAALAGMRPLVFTPHYHGGGHSRAARLAHIPYRPMSRLLFRACARIVCVSAAEARALIRDFPQTEASVTVVPNGVDETAFANAKPFEHSSTIALAAGRMEHHKQFDRVALAAEFLPRGHEIVMLGEGPVRPELDELVVRHGLQGRVRLLGRVGEEDLRRWFGTAAVFVSMSRRESFGLTIVEALAAATPVVASDIPAHRETAEAQPPGAVRLVSVDAQPREIAEAIADAARVGAPPGVRVTSWDDVADEMLGIYLSVGQCRLPTGGPLR